MRTHSRENVELKSCWCFPIKRFDLASAYSTDSLTVSFIFDGDNYRINHDAVEEVPNGVSITHRELIIAPAVISLKGDSTVFTVTFSNLHSLIRDMAPDEYLTVEVEHTLDGIVDYIALTKKTCDLNPIPIEIS
ncbi:hypothetical protein SM033_00015 [Vibrio phage vB_VpaM_sm033]|nr:hypothetical protein SM033_00015 [Vibrio phage vB_VpaM_sm033]